jgi:hypothetical protein
MIKTIVSHDGQSMYDLCLMAYRTLDKIVKFCTDNGVSDINYVPPLPQSFVYDTNLTTDQKTGNFVYATVVVGATTGGDLLLADDGSPILGDDGTNILID